MKRLKTILFSLPLSGILLMLFAIAIAVATFIENDFGTRAAKSVIFNAKWFELLLLLLTINLIGSVFKEKMYRKEKFAIFLFHISFIVILFGAAITRYISYEGSMHIREGKSSNTIVSESTYLKVFINDGQNDFYSEKKLLLAPLGSNDFSMKMKVNDQKIDIKYKDFYRNAEEKIVEEEGGVEMISLAVFDGKSRHDISIMDMEVKQFNGMMFTLNDTSLTQAVILTNTDSGLFIKSPMEVAYFKMLQKDSGLIESHSFSEIQQQALYTIGQIQFVISNVSKSAKIAYSEAGKGHENLNDALVINVSVGDQLQEVVLLGKENQLGSMANVEFENISLSLSYGSKLITLPFSLHLNDFQLDRYPGSNSPSSFASEVTVIDNENNIEKPYRIFMNNILNYGGYRFFQSNFDPDEKGTILSVNHD
ncbi:MAG: cytochrome C biogenesis protein, partial [Bacteroidetes bacterium]|nr:cytochrome C biogenesis protein [Bacteroidota bacterium]